MWESRIRDVLSLFLIALCCAGLAHWIRLESAVGVGFPEPRAWGSYDADTLYHARRVERGVRSGGWIASRDPLLAHGSSSGPNGEARSVRGTPIPWPPFYDLALTAAYRGALPSAASLMRPEDNPVAPPLGQDERDRVERFVASRPLWIATLTAFLAALFGGGLAREALRGRPFQRTGALSAAAFAGTYLALSYAHVRYSRLGNGDHHAFISLAHLVMLGITARGLRHGLLSQPVWSAVRGAFAGLVAGIMLTTWTASIFWIALLQAVLLFRLLAPFRDEQGRRFSARGLPIFATSFHKAALLVAVPAVIESPFKEEAPWSLVNLSWFHLAWLSVGWLVFAPYALMPKTSSQHRAVSLLPAALVGGLLLFITPALESLREATSWASASNAFMGSIEESRPLLLGPGGSISLFAKFSGWAVLALPFAILFLARRWALHPERLPFLAAAAGALVAAAMQRRFAEALAGPSAVVLALALAALLSAVLKRVGAARTSVVGLIFYAAGAAALAAAMFPWTLRNASQFGALQDAGHSRFPNGTAISKSEAELANFLDEVGGALRDSETAADGGGAPGVLAHWDLGHKLEWRAGLATVATNFGLYVGEDAFLDPWRFLLSTGDAEAKKILDDRAVTYVFFDGDRNWQAMGETLDKPVQDPAFWNKTMSARLSGAKGADAAPGFLALRALGSRSAGPPMKLFEVVEGAALVAESARSLRVEAVLQGPLGARVVWGASARAPAGSPVALEVRVPYASPFEGPAEAAAEGPIPVGESPGPWVRVMSLAVFVDEVERQQTITPASVVNGSVIRL